jgi:drug/metabolite transporter (DMT)-like permease
LIIKHCSQVLTFLQNQHSEFTGEIIMFLTILATLSYSLMLISLNRGPLFTNGYLVGTLINLFGALIPFTFFLIGGMRLEGSNNVVGVSWGIAGGIGIALFTISMTFLFAGGGTLGFVSPIVYGGSIVIVTLIGFHFFREGLTGLHLSGIGMVLLGIGLIVFAQYRGVTS